MDTENIKMKALEQLRDFFDTLSVATGEKPEGSEGMGGEGAEVELELGESEEMGEKSPEQSALSQLAGEEQPQEESSPMAPKVDIKELMRKHGRTGSGSKGAVVEVGYMGLDKRK